MSYEGIVLITNVVFSIAVLFLFVYYLTRHKQLDELSRRFLVVGFFFAVHEITFFLQEPFIFELTKTLFFVTLFYAFSYVISSHYVMKKTIEAQSKANEEMKKRLDDIKQEIKEGGP